MFPIPFDRNAFGCLSWSAFGLKDHYWRQVFSEHCLIVLFIPAPDVQAKDIVLGLDQWFSTMFFVSKN